MTNDPKNKKDEKKPISKPDPETLHTTDPQEHMKGPVSSVMQNLKEEGEKNDKVSKEEAERKRDEHM
jgi:hypothetical protein